MRISDWSSDVCSSDLLFTPNGDILALPRNSTALDFAYAVHTDVGNQAVAARVDRKLVPLRTKLVSGQKVEIVTAKSSSPKPQWLEFVVTGKARTAIRHQLKHLEHEDARSEEHTSELQSLMRTSYAVFCLKKKTKIRR